MLKGLDPLLGPDLLATLRGMGHGDEIAIVDGNYPAISHGQRIIRADGLALEPVLRAILSILPLDSDVARPVMRTCNANHPDQPDPIHKEIDAILLEAIAPTQLELAHGTPFYDRAKQCHAIVATSEPALFANVILRKGVISGLHLDAPSSRDTQ